VTRKARSIQRTSRGHVIALVPIWSGTVTHSFEKTKTSGNSGIIDFKLAVRDDGTSVLLSDSCCTNMYY
jgi:hypothetical protein